MMKRVYVGGSEKPADVLEAVREYISRPVFRWQETYGIQGKVSAQITAAERERRGGPEIDVCVDPKIHGQIERALRKLMDEGLLIKISPGQPRPDGGTQYNYTLWYTPLAFEQEKEAALEKARAEELIRARWAAVYDGLELRGINVGESTKRGSAVALTLGEFERLVSRCSYTDLGKS